MDHELRPFTVERLQLVRQVWRELAGGDEFATEMTAAFDWCGTHLSPQAGDSQGLELYNVVRDQTDAILELIDSDRGAKLLKLWLSPEFWNIELQDIRTRVVRLHAAAFLQVIQAGITRGAPLVKIYGRSDLMLVVLRALHDEWPSLGTGLVAAMQGRWLAISL